MSSPDLITSVIGVSAVPLPAGAGNGGSASSDITRRACRIAWSAYRPLREVGIVEGLSLHRRQRPSWQGQQHLRALGQGITKALRFSPPHAAHPRTDIEANLSWVRPVGRGSDDDRPCRAFEQRQQGRRDKACS